MVEFHQFTESIIFVLHICTLTCAVHIESSRRCGILLWNASSYEQFKDAEDLAWAIQKPLHYQISSTLRWEMDLFWTENRILQNDFNWTSRKSQYPPPESGYIFQESRSISPYSLLIPGNSELGMESQQMIIGPLSGRIRIVPPGQLLAEWLDTLDVVILLGASITSICDFMARKRQTKCVDQVCCVILPGFHVRTIEAASSKDNLGKLNSYSEIWARGPVEEQIFGALPEYTKMRVVLIPWSTSDWVVRVGIRASDSIEDVLVVLIITAASTAREGDIRTTCAAFSEAIRSARSGCPRMILKIDVMAPLGEWVQRQVEESEECMAAGAIKIAEHSTPAQLQLAIRAARVALFPSASEPSALRTLALQALHGGVPLVAVAAPPFSEVAVHEHDALLLQPAGPSASASIGDLAEALRRLADPQAPAHLRTGLLRRLTCPQPGLLSARQHAFAMHIGHRLNRRAGEPPPSAVSFWPGPHPEHRRTELFRSEALRRHGFAVREATYAEPLAPLFGPADGRAGAVRFAVAAKPRTEFLRRLAEAAPATPVFVWTWDLIDFAHDPGRRPWFEAAARGCRAAFLNEMGRERMWAAGGGGVHFVNDGTVFIGDRGAGRRPRRPPGGAGGAQAVFVGTVAAGEASERHGRTRLLRAVMRAGECLIRLLWHPAVVTRAGESRRRGRGAGQPRWAAAARPRLAGCSAAREPARRDAQLLRRPCG